MEWIEKYAKVKKEKVHAILPKLQKFGALAATLLFVQIVGDIEILSLGFFRISPFLTIFFMTVGKIARYLAVIGLMKTVM